MAVNVKVVPMQPTLVREPFHRQGWVYERKEDGWRMLAFKDGSHFRLVSRQGVDHTSRFADIAAAVAKLSESLVYVKEQLGHSTIKVTVDVYGHLIPGANKAAVDRLDGPSFGSGGASGACEVAPGLHLVQ